MMDIVASPAGLIALFAIFGLGGLGSLAVRKHDRIANIWTNVMAIIGSVWGMFFASSIFVTGKEVAARVATSSFLQFSVSLHVDQLAAFFIFVISLVALFCSMYGLGYVKEYYKRLNLGTLGFFYSFFILGMLMVVTAANGLWFLLAWEVMSLASYFLVVYDRADRQNVKAGYVYLIMTHVGALAILLAFALLYNYTHSFDFYMIKAQIGAVPELVVASAFVLAFIGLGTKAGVVPLHIWLPSAHPAAPSHVSALMSGVMIKTGIYMMVRLFLDIMGTDVPLWWGVLVLVVGAVSSLIGVLFALTEHDLKRLLAYHSIENIGIILLGLGSALVFTTLGRPGLALLSLAAALFHTLNHAAFKSLLFLGAGSVIQATHTRNIEAYGGLMKLLPSTGLFFLVGSMAISALPPFNGFFSEWLTFQALFSGIAGIEGWAHWVFVAAAVSLALTGGLALACFVKAMGTTFLARPRSRAAKRAKEAAQPMRAGMAGLAIICLLVGIVAAPVIGLIEDVSRSTTGVASAASVLNVSSPEAVAVGTQRSVVYYDQTGTIALLTEYDTVEVRSSVSGPVAFLFLLLVPAGVWLGARYGVYRRQKITDGPVWDCGTDLNERMEITATGFSQSIIRVFKGLLFPSLRQSVEYYDDQHLYAVKTRKAYVQVWDIYQSYIYRPLYAGIRAAAQAIRVIHHGNLNAYVLYIFAAMIIVLLVVGV